MRKFTISDIHGCNKTFEALLDKIQFTTKDELYLLGDFVDRGPDSKGVIDTIIRLQKEGHYVECIRGNHEEQMLNARKSISDLAHWWGWGGKETTASFGYTLHDDIFKIPNEYWDWIDQLPYFSEVDDYILVHAGLDFTHPDPLNNMNSLIWIRNWYSSIKYKWLGTRKVVHGHTPQTRTNIEIAAKNLDNLQVINIDNGCFKSGAGQGNLCAFELGTRRLYFHTCVDEITWRR